ncbi:6487_t:CDS:2 [Scutellospora calospora]|uniref:6487_t:CDS:1 n=1 Tax=Scutellospora calospora TaxID=85575 RepID=A0ACA9KKV2_9GLOM|nr:6487_t:CDS:2 [Scutellospora calospora]
MDSFQAHIVSSVKKYISEKNTNLVVVPGGLTPKVQPLDVRKFYNDWISQEIKKLIPTGKIQRPAYNDSVDIQLIQCSFKCCNVSTMMDGLEEDMIFDYNSLEAFEESNSIIQQNQVSFVIFDENQEYNEFESYYISQEAGNYIN